MPLQRRAFLVSAAALAFSAPLPVRAQDVPAVVATTGMIADAARAMLEALQADPVNSAAE